MLDIVLSSMIGSFIGFGVLGYIKSVYNEDEIKKLKRCVDDLTSSLHDLTRRVSRSTEDSICH